MSPIRYFTSDEARIVDLAQRFSPSYMPEYLMWTYVWRHDPQNGRGPLPSPVGDRLLRGIFWDVLDSDGALVQCYQAPAIRARLETLLEEGR